MPPNAFSYVIVRGVGDGDRGNHPLRRTQLPLAVLSPLRAAYVRFPYPFLRTTIALLPLHQLSWLSSVSYSVCTVFSSYPFVPLLNVFSIYLSLSFPLPFFSPALIPIDQPLNSYYTTAPCISCVNRAHCKVNSPK